MDSSSCDEEEDADHEVESGCGAAGVVDGDESMSVFVSNCRSSWSKKSR